MSGWWTARQRLYAETLELQTVDSVIRRAQSGTSGFDHRELRSENIPPIVNFKLQELRMRFPDFHLEDVALQESEHSMPESLITVGTKRLSSIFLTHLYFYLRTSALSPEAKRVCEIGTGYGGLARIYKLMRPDLTYVLIDLPESLFYAQVFLTVNFPDAKIGYVNEAFPDNPDDYDFIFVPAQLAHLLRGQSFDLTVNTGSLQEMTTAAVRHWMEFIQDVIQTKQFYSWNYFLNDKSLFNETLVGHNLICPILDPFWELRYFRINDPVITVDCDQRNWLEVCVSRLPESERTDVKLLQRVRTLIDAANTMRSGTQYWFQNIWMAVWINPAPQILDAMLEGLDYFREGKTFGVPNHLDVSEFSETQFYRNVRNLYAE